MENILHEILGELKSLNGRVSNIEEGQQELKAEVGSLRTEVGSLKVEVDLLKVGQQELNNSVDLLKVGQQELNNRIDLLKEGQQSLKAEVRSGFESIRAEMTDKFDVIARQVQENTTKLDVITESLDALAVHVDNSHKKQESNYANLFTRVEILEKKVI